MGYYLKKEYTIPFETLALMDKGFYSPLLYEKLAILLHKQKRYQEEIDLILQMKMDLEYHHLDTRLRKLLYETI